MTLNHVNDAVRNELLEGSYRVKSEQELRLPV